MLNRALALTALTALTLALCGACTQSEADACGKGNVYRDGDCHPESVATAGSGPTASDGGAGTEAGAAGAPSEATDPNFGATCSTSEDCQGVTNYCVPMSPFDTAYCSVQDCDPADPNACPATWTCTNLSRFVAGLPWACTRPTN
jgi:hypothetical protein